MKRKFKRQCFWLKKLGTKWRKPKGRHSKLAHEKKGRWDVPKVGYGRNSAERGMIFKGGEALKPITINNVKDLEKIRNKTEAGMIASAVGSRKAEMIIAEAQKKGIKIINRKAKKAKPKKEAAKKEEKK